MRLYELLYVINDDTHIELHSSNTNELIASAEDEYERTHGDVSETFDECEQCEVLDVFVSEGKLCIEIDDESED